MHLDLNDNLNMDFDKFGLIETLISVGNMYDFEYPLSMVALG